MRACWRIVSEIRETRNLRRRQLEVTPIPAFEDNYFWILVQDGHALVVDPGAAQPVADFLARRELTLDAILVTHHHADHIGGVARLVEATGASVIAPHDSRIDHVDRRVSEGQLVQFERFDLEFEVMATPGHTLSHIAYFTPGLLFCGDTLFSLGCGRLFEGSPAQMLSTLDRIAALPDATRVYCAHEYTLDNARFALRVDPGNRALTQRIEQAQQLRAAGQPTLPAILGEEKAANPFLRSDSDGVRSGLAEQIPEDADRVTSFAALRAWKDRFRG